MRVQAQEMLATHPEVGVELTEALAPHILDPDDKVRRTDIYAHAFTHSLSLSSLSLPLHVTYRN